MENKTILKKLIGREELNKNDNFSNEEKQAINSFFRKYVKENKVWDDLLLEIGESEYKRLEDFIKLVHGEYFSLQKMCHNQAENLLVVFERCIVVFDKKTYVRMVKTYDETIINDVIQVLGKVVDFCIDNRNSLETFSEILVNYYDCPKNIADSVAELFEKNRIQLSLYKLLALRGK